mgnify:CR=1 FL=1
MKCEELEAIVFSGKAPTDEQRAQMQEHAKTCEACRALMENAELLGGMREIDDDVELPESFKTGWREAVRAQSRPPIRFEEQAKKRRARPTITRILSYAACAAVVLASGIGLGRLSSGGVSSTSEYQSYYDMVDSDYGVSYESETSGVGMRSMASGVSKNTQQDKKIVRRAWLNFKTDSFDEAVDALRGRVTDMGGSVENCDISGTKDASRTASLTLRVPSEQLDALLEGAGELGEITREQTTAVDMTDTYTDNASRLESARAKKQQLDALYAKAENMEDIITLTNALFDVQEEIDALEGQNRQIDDNVSFATLVVSISEKSSAVSAKQPFLTRMGRQFADGLEHFSEFISDSVLALVYALPWLAVMAVAFAVVVKVVRKKRGK